MKRKPTQSQKEQETTNLHSAWQHTLGAWQHTFGAWQHTLGLSDGVKPNKYAFYAC